MRNIKYKDVETIQQRNKIEQKITEHNQKVKFLGVTLFTKPSLLKRVISLFSFTQCYNSEGVLLGVLSPLLPQDRVLKVAVLKQNDKRRFFTTLQDVRSRWNP